MITKCSFRGIIVLQRIALLQIQTVNRLSIEIIFKINLLNERNRVFLISLLPQFSRPLTVHNMNIQTDRYFEGEESSSVRKQTFGKDTATNSDAKEIHIPTRENREYYNDEVRIMETGYSSSRKVDTERDFFAGHPHNNEQIVVIFTNFYPFSVSLEKFE